MFQKQMGESLLFQRPFLQINVKCQPAPFLVNIVCLPLWAPLLNTTHKALNDWTFVSVPIFVLLHSQPVSFYDEFFIGGHLPIHITLCLCAFAMLLSLII